MLAVQSLPRMGSPQPPPPAEDTYMPFGYSVDPNEPFFDPPEPAPGAPLLTETDTKFLTSFFDDMTANQYSMPSFGEGLNFSDAWLDLPPQFMGTATSFGQQESPQFGTAPTPGNSNGHIMSNEPHFIPPPPPPPPAQSRTQSAPEDVLHAAATLANNGHRRDSNGDDRVPRRPVPVGHLRHQPLEEFKEEGRRSNAAHAYPDDRAYADWMFAPRERRTLKNSQSSMPPAFQWGSDAAFGDVRGYTPDTTQRTVESQQKEQLKVLECLEVDKSAANTRSNSPIRQAPLPPPRTNSRQLPPPIKPPEDADAPPRKRRKSGRDDDDDGRLPTPKSATRKKPPRPNTPPDEPKASRRRKPNNLGHSGAAPAAAAAAAANKTPRENLSEEQKRENHIKSEQKRRTVIKEGFDELCQLVPGLRGGGFSKSTMLAMTAEYLEEILKGNKALDRQLEALR